jgi:Ca2+-binding RTX toxin-like protein
VAGEGSCGVTKNDDTINGSEEGDLIYGRGGADRLFGNGGEDNLHGGNGYDTMRGGEGNDSITYGSHKGVDLIYGGGGNDDLWDSSRNVRRETDDKNVLAGGEGDDFLYGHTKFFGGPGHDTLDVEYPYKDTRTTLDGGPGFDTITGDRSVDTVYAQDRERDEITCGGNEDTVYFDQGIDVVDTVTC